MGRRDIGKWSRKAGSATNLPPPRPQPGRPKPCRSCGPHVNWPRTPNSNGFFPPEVIHEDIGPGTVMCHAESHIVSSTSSCCSSRCFRDLRRARICVSPQREGWGRLRACRRKQGAGDGAPSRRARFDGAVRRVDMATRRGRIDECVGAWRVLPRRKRRPWPRTPVHKGALRFPRRRPGLVLPGVARGAARGKTSVLGRLRRRGPHIKREARRRKRRARGRAKRSNSCGRPRGSAFVSSDQPSGGRSRRVGRKSSGPFQEESKPGLEAKAQRLALLA